MQVYEETIEAREDGGTPGILQAVRCGLAFKLKETVGSERVEHREQGFGQAALDMVFIVRLTLLILDYSSRPLRIAGPILGVSDLQHVPTRARYQSQVEFEFPFL